MALPPISGSSGPVTQNPYGDGSTAGASGGGLFGEGVSQSVRVAISPVQIGGLNVPAWPFGDDADPRSGELGRQIVVGVIVAVISAAVMIYIKSRK